MIDETSRYKRIFMPQTSITQVTLIQCQTGAIATIPVKCNVKNTRTDVNIATRT